MDIDRKEGLASFDRVMVRRIATIGAIGLAVSVAVYVLASVLKKSAPIRELRIVLAGLEGLGLGLSAATALFAVAGGLGLILPNWKTRKIVGLTLVIVAAVTFVFIPFCWDPKSDDCRSIVDRARDAVFR